MGFLLLQERRGWRGNNHMKELIYSWQSGPWCERSHELASGISSHKEDMSFSHLQDSFTIGLWSSNKRLRHKSPGKSLLIHVHG
ncbi:unnamed protein product [Musa hybrid cultivar]